MRSWTRAVLPLIIALILLIKVIDWSAVAQTVVQAVDTNSVQTISNKTLDATNSFAGATTSATVIAGINNTGKLKSSDINPNTVSGTVAHRFETCASGAAGAVTMTLPSSPAAGEIYTLIQQNASFTCAFSRASSQTIDGATSVTLTAGLAVNKDCTVLALSGGSSANWHAMGSCS